jgi:hypothetical protein
MSELIPIGSIALAEQFRMRQTACTRGRKLLGTKLSLPIGAEMSDALVDRDCDYPNDFIVPTAGAAAALGLAGWLSMPMALPATMYSLFATVVPGAVAPVVPNNQAWVFFGVHVLTLNDPITVLQFLTGRAPGIPKATFDVEKLYDRLETSGYFTQPVVYEPQEICTVNIRSRVATVGVGARVVLDCVIIERGQVTLA